MLRECRDSCGSWRIKEASFTGIGWGAYHGSSREIVAEPVIRHEQEEFILDERTAHAKAGHLAPVRRLEITGREHARRGLLRYRRQRIGRAPDVIAIIEI